MTLNSSSLVTVVDRDRLTKKNMPVPYRGNHKMKLKNKKGNKEKDLKTKHKSTEIQVLSPHGHIKLKDGE